MLITCTIRFSESETEKLTKLFGDKVKSADYHSDGFVNFNGTHAIPIDDLKEFFAEKSDLDLVEFIINPHKQPGEILLKYLVAEENVIKIKKYYERKYFSKDALIKAIATLIGQNSSTWSQIDDNFDNHIISSACKQLALETQLEFAYKYPQYFNEILSIDELAQLLIRKNKKGKLAQWIGIHATQLSNESLIALACRFTELDFKIRNEIYERKLFAKNKIFYATMKKFYHITYMSEFDKFLTIGE